MKPTTRHCPTCQRATHQERWHQNPPYIPGPYIIGWVCQTCGNTCDVNRYEITSISTELIDRAHQIATPPQGE